ncbi:MAG: C39 family peptidase [bacterium]
MDALTFRSHQSAAILIFSVWLLLNSCAGIREASLTTSPRSSCLIAGVPFYRQKAHQCGPASLAGVLNYWGVNVLPRDIAREIYSESAGGTLGIDMALYARRRSLQACQYRSSPDDLKQRLGSGCPMIVMVDNGFWAFQQNHFMVIVGYDENHIIANSGDDRHKSVPLQQFMKAWERTNFWALLITPER